MPGLMADTTQGNRKSVESSTSPILVLPAELCNKIYSYLYQFLRPIHVFFGQDPASRVSKAVITLNITIPVALFASCRQLGAEAASALYTNNTFMLTRVLGTEGFVRLCCISALLTFLDTVGFQATLLRRVVFDTHNICNGACHRTYLDWKTRLFDPMDGIVEVTSLLRAVWDRRLSFKLDMIALADVSEDRATYWKQTTDLSCNTTVMAIIQSLMDDQLSLRGYRGLVCAVAVKRDGSGGLISWGSTPRGIHNTIWPRYHPHLVSEFSAQDGGTRLHFVRRALCTLLELPSPIWSKIMRAVVFPDESLHIDLDVETGFVLGLPHVNKKLRAGIKPTCLLGNRYTLTMSTTQTRSDFEAFDRLRRVLRKVITYVTPEGISRDFTLESGYGGIERIVLLFRLDFSPAFEDLRINVLPLVMETSSTLGYKEVTVRVRRDIHVKETSFSLQTLRLNVAKALKDVSLLNDKPAEPEFWINGMGEVVETHRRISSPASSSSTNGPPRTAFLLGPASDGFWKLTYIHPKDREYQGRREHRVCLFCTLEEFFPFHNSAANMLEYLPWVLEKYDIEEWRRPKLE